MPTRNSLTTTIVAAHARVVSSNTLERGLIAALMALAGAAALMLMFYATFLHPTGTSLVVTLVGFGIAVVLLVGAAYTTAPEATQRFVTFLVGIAQRFLPGGTGQAPPSPPSPPTPPGPGAGA